MMKITNIHPDQRGMKYPNWGLLGEFTATCVGCGFQWIPYLSEYMRIAFEEHWRCRDCRWKCGCDQDIAEVARLTFLPVVEELIYE